VVFGYGVHAQSGAVSASIVSPANGALTGDSLWVVAKVTSTLEIQRVSARVEGREVDLGFSPTAYYDKYRAFPGWTNSISLVGLARGTNTVIVEGTDFFGNSAHDQRDFVYDRKPILEVTFPLSLSVARPQIRVSASCSDDDPIGCALRVSAGPVLASGHNSVDKVVSLAQYEGGAVTLHFEAADSAGQTTAIDIPVYVESSVRLSETQEVAGGIWNVLPDRILFLESKSDRGILKIHNRATKVETVVIDQAGRFPQYGALAPKGAMFVGEDGLIYDERDGNVIALGVLDSKYSLVVEGNYAIWNSGQTLILRDLLTGQNTTVSQAAGNWKNDVASNGDVVFWGSDYAVYRYRSGTTQRLSPDTGVWYTYVLTDGTWAVYRKGWDGLVMNDGTGEIELIPRGTGPELAPGSNFQIANGWVAYTKPGTSGQLQVWTRSPEGKQTQLTHFGDNSRMSALASNGEVMFSHGRRYLSRPGETPIEIDSGLGTAFWQQGEWWVTLGRSLFKVQPGNASITLSPGTLSGGTFKITVSAGDGQAVTMQTSLDLVEWTDLGTRIVTGGAIEFSDITAGGSDRRFYRGKMP